MGYQALLFCPDEKTARSVTQVLSELDFTVTPCTEPFGAVKKLMGEHFDAVVVDCDNEQNATLLFKSARNTPNNQSALAVAVVEGQAGVAKAFRIGANLVLTKPINVEQAKGTLRVARGLLRKNEAGKPAAPAAAAPAATVKPAVPAPAPPKPAPQAPTTKVVATRPAPPVAPLGKTATASVPPQRLSQPKVVASIPADDESDAEILDIDEIVSPSIAAPGTKIAASESDVLSPTPTMGASPAGLAGFGSGAASAPAPAREAKPKTVIPEPESPAEKAADSTKNISSNEGTSAPAPAFTFGGNVSDGGKAGGGGSKKMLLVAAAVVLVAAGGYALWMQWVGSSGAATPFAHVAAPVTKPAVAPQAAPSKAPVGASSSAVSPFALTGLGAGAHTVTVSKAGYSTDTRTVNVASGSKAFVTSHLSLLMATLAVSSSPAGANVYIDGKDSGKLTPAQVPVDKGQHVILVRKSGYIDQTTSAQFALGQTTNFSPTLQTLGNVDDIKTVGKMNKLFGGKEAQGMGTVSVKTQPKGAQVAVNQHMLDKDTPVNFILDPGNYIVDITLSGYGSVHRVISVDKGGKVVIDEVLQHE